MPTDDLRDRLIAAIREVPGPTVTGAAEAALAVVTPELERLRGALAEARDVTCPGCMEREQQRDEWAETSRQSGIRAEQNKQAWYRERRRAEQAEAAIERVRALHIIRGRNIHGDDVCAECSPLQPYPCPTIRALDAPESPASDRTGVPRHANATEGAAEAQEARDGTPTVFCSHQSDPWWDEGEKQWFVCTLPEGHDGDHKLCVSTDG